MDNDNNNRQRQDSEYSNKVRAGKRRTYFFDVRRTKGDDFYLTLTESTKRFDNDGYERHKIFLYKEDFTKFGEALAETITHIKTELNPEFDYDAYDRETYQASIEEGYDDDDTDERSQQPARAERQERPARVEREQKEFKKPVRPNKDFTAMPFASSNGTKSILDKDTEDLPSNDDVMEW